MKRLFPIVCLALVVPLVVIGMVRGGRASHRADSGAPVPRIDPRPGPRPTPTFGPQPRIELRSPVPVSTGPAGAPRSAPQGRGVPVVDAPGRADTGVTAGVSVQATTGADPLAAWGPAPAPLVDPRRFAEAHWQGLEVIPKTPALAKSLGLPADAQGVVVDDASLPADIQGFQAGDLVARVGGVRTPDLLRFVQASDLVRDEKRVEVEVFRQGKSRVLTLTALMARLGTANGETPPMIQPGAPPPHKYQGPCTDCHRIGATGQMAIDQGDIAPKTAPPIRAGATRPHRNWGTCTTCHQLLP